MFLYNKQKVAMLFNAEPEVMDILDSDGEEEFICPYDKLVICTDRLPVNRFINLIDHLKFEVEDDGTYYRHRLVYSLFSVQWLHQNSKTATTSIMLNPNKHRLSPTKVLKLIDFIIGNYHDAFVVANDDKIDCMEILNTREVAQRLYVGHQKKPPRDYLELGETFMYGKRNGQQVRNYDKGLEQGITEIAWTRLERTIKRRQKQSRPTVMQFLLDERRDALAHTKLVDIEQFSGRDVNHAKNKQVWNISGCIYVLG